MIRFENLTAIPKIVQSMREGVSNGFFDWFGFNGDNDFTTALSLFLIIIIGVITLASMQSPMKWKRFKKRKTPRGTPIRAHTSIRQRRVRRRDRRNRGEGYSVRRGTRVED